MEVKKDGVEKESKVKNTLWNNEIKSMYACRCVYVSVYSVYYNNLNKKRPTVKPFGAALIIKFSSGWKK